MADQDFLDQNLSDLADTLMRGQPPGKTLQAMSSEERIVQQLYKIIAPEQTIDPAFRQRLTGTLNSEWDQVRPNKSRSRSPLVFRFRPIQVLAAAAAIALVFAVFLVSGDSGSLSGTGASQDGLDASALLILFGMVALLGVFGLVFYLWNRRR
jgi:hypothetical protein